MNETAQDILDYATKYDAMPEPPTAKSFLDTLSSSIGSVADFGFNLQKQQLAVQSQAMDTQLQTLKATLGFKTAATQAEAGATIAGYQAQGAIAQAAKSAGISTGQGMSVTMVALIAVGAYFLAKKT
jgi:hypothetical protein